MGLLPNFFKRILSDFDTSHRESVAALTGVEVK